MGHRDKPYGGCDKFCLWKFCLWCVMGIDLRMGIGCIDRSSVGISCENGV